MSNVSTFGDSLVCRESFWLPERWPSFDWQSGGGEEGSIPRATSNKRAVIVDLDLTCDVLGDQSDVFYSNSAKSKYGTVVIVPYRRVQSYNASEDLYYSKEMDGSVAPREIQSDVFLKHPFLQDLNAFEPVNRRINHVNKDIADDEVQQELNEFSEGIEGVRPARQVVEMAVRISIVAIESTEQPDITVDIDGELSFYLRLKDGRLVLAELGVEGLIDASVYDEKDKLLKRMPSATEEELIAVLKS